MSIWPVEGRGPNQWNWHKTRLAMAQGTNRHKLLKSVLPRHFAQTAHDLHWGIDVPALMQRLAERTPGAIAAVGTTLPAGFNTPVAEAVFGRLATSAERLLAAL